MDPSRPTDAWAPEASPVPDPSSPTAPAARATGPVVLRGPARVLRGPARRPLQAAAAVVVATAVVALRDPHQAGSYGVCPLRALTGLWCPACGGLRATHDLAHGDLAGAWSMNPLWVAAVPVVVVLWAVWLRARLRGRPLPTAPRWVPWAGLAVVLVFGVARNVPALAPWLAP